MGPTPRPLTRAARRILPGLALGLLGLSGLAAQPPALPGRVAPGDPHFDLEVLYHQGRLAEGRAETLRQLAAHPDDADLYLHAVRFSYELGELSASAAPALDREGWYLQMVSWSEEALRLRPSDPRARFARAVSRGRLATTRGVLDSLGALAGIEADLRYMVDHAAPYTSLGGEEVQPCDATLALGMMYRYVPDLWVLEVAAGMRGDLERSVRLLRQADACAPGRIESVKELGVGLVCFGQRRGDPAALAEGERTLQRALRLHPTEPTDVIDHEHIRRILEDPALACGYSRDGQAQIDAAALAGLLPP